MNLTEMRAKVKRICHNRTELTNSDFDLALNNALQTLSRGVFLLPNGMTTVLRFRELEELTEITLYAANPEYDYPTDAEEIQTVEFKNSYNSYESLKFLGWDNFSQLSSLSAGRPTVFTVRKRKIYLNPVPSTEYQDEILRVGYYKKPLTLSDSNPTPEIPSAYHRVLPFFAGHELLSELGDEGADAAFKTGLMILQMIQDNRKLNTVGVMNPPVAGGFFNV